MRLFNNGVERTLAFTSEKNTWASLILFEDTGEEIAHLEIFHRDFSRVIQVLQTKKEDDLKLRSIDFGDGTIEYAGGEFVEINLYGSVNHKFYLNRLERVELLGEFQELEGLLFGEYIEEVCYDILNGISPQLDTKIKFKREISIFADLHNEDGITKEDINSSFVEFLLLYGS